MKRKKGEITSGQIVGIIVLVICFVVILLLWRIYQWNPVVDRESCHQSIVYRSSVNWGVIKASKVVPLKCQTERICMTMSGEDCPQVGKNSKDNPVTKVQLDKDPEKARKEIIDQIMNSMYDCHSMLGEGQLLFMPNNVGWGEKYWTKQNYCLICTRLVLDLEAREKIEDIRYSELYQALGNRLNSQKKTYLEYLHPDWKDWKSAAKLFQQLKEDNAKRDNSMAGMKLEDWKMNLDEENGFALVAQIAPTSYWMSLAGTGAAVGGALLIASGVGAPAGVALIGAGAAGAATFWYNSPTGEFVYSPPKVEPYNLERMQSMACDSFETAP